MEEAGTRDSKVHTVVAGFGDGWGFFVAQAGRL